MQLILDLGNLWEMLSAIGTVGAVIISLWLARRTEKPSCYIYYCIDYDSETDKSTHIFEILNIGQVPTTLLYEGLSRHKRLAFSKQVDFDGVLEWTYSEKNLPTNYSSTLRPGESVYLEVEDDIMKQTMHQLVGSRKQEKFIFILLIIIIRRMLQPYQFKIY
ncbi:Uncharacterised protein [Streptococcus constellatus]|uniref:Uncharacterized protein n=1 Tax=Streptococcus constellatus TaxID=76860 RepID=A0A564TU55_STRCV|nr:hypothetical protein [Streptococcus constellatus]VUX10764.1 Uncharacterised protein [Streptococcus constellatus]VUX13084.1 Uncharacterised protein [Streptococcus gordonii]